MESGGNKRKFGLGMAFEHDAELYSDSTSSDSVCTPSVCPWSSKTELYQPEATASTKRRRRSVRRGSLSPVDAFDSKPMVASFLLEASL